MPNWPSDKELEEIYRRGTEGHDFQYNEAAWNDMESLLDKSRKRKYFFFMWAVIALGGFMYLLSPLVTSDLDTRETLTETNVDIDSNASNSLLSNNNSSTPEVATIQESSSELKATIPSKINESQSNHSGLATVDIYRSKRASTVNDTPNNSRSEISNYENITRVEKQKLIGKSLEDKDHLSTSLRNPNKENIEQVVGDVINAAEKSIIDNELQYGLAYLNRLSYSPFPVALKWNMPTPALTPMPTETKTASNIFILGLTLGAESSWTSQGESSDIDMNIGLRTSYYINNKVGVNLGLSYINDVYSAPGSDYNAKEDFWKASGAPGIPTMTLAESSMLELSAGATYAFNGIQNNGLSIGANLNSNFMLNERYEYLYPNESHNFNSAWTMANKTWLNAIDLSTSYRFRLRNKWLLETGPYFKVPLSGIGHGDMKLTSFGIRVHLGISN